MDFYNSSKNKSLIGHIRRQKSQNTKITNFQYIYKISVFLPFCDFEKKPLNTTTLTENACFYKVEKLSPVVFLYENFVNNFLKCGSISAISYRTRLICDDCFCILNDGMMVLSLTKQTYQVSQLCGQKINELRYHVNIDLMNLSKKARAKLVNKLTNINLEFDTAIVWDPFNKTYCPSSIAQYLHDQNYVIKLQKPLTKTKLEKGNNFAIPDLDKCNDQLAKLVEWFGFYDRDCFNGEIMHLDTLSNEIEQCPKIGCESFSYFSLTGFLTIRSYENLIDLLREYFHDSQQTSNSRKWFAIYLHGFSNLPVFKTHRDVNLTRSCDDHGSILIFNGHQFNDIDVINLRTGK